MREPQDAWKYNEFFFVTKNEKQQLRSADWPPSVYSVSFNRPLEDEKTKARHAATQTALKRCFVINANIKKFSGAKKQKLSENIFRNECVQNVATQYPSKQVAGDRVDREIEREREKDAQRDQIKPKKWREKTDKKN